MSTGIYSPQLLFSERIPGFIEEGCRNPQMERIRHIDMNCGMNYTDFEIFRSCSPYSRFDHSLAAALIIWHFTHDEKQALAGLYHDIATPVFSHVVDFLNGDYMNQESTEQRTGQMIHESEEIQALLKKMNIHEDEINDYHMYPAADLDPPFMCADRLEYTVGNSIRYGFADIDEIMDICADLILSENEYGKEEIIFCTQDKAEKFAELAYRCSVVYASDQNRCAMEYLAGLLRKAVRQGVINTESLYGREDEIVHILEMYFPDEWYLHCHMNTVRVSQTRKEGWFNVDAKRRTIDPYIRFKGRVLSLNNELYNKVNQFRNQSFDYWMKPDIEGDTYG